MVLHIDKETLPALIRALNGEQLTGAEKRELIYVCNQVEALNSDVSESKIRNITRVRG